MILDNYPVVTRNETERYSYGPPSGFRKPTQIGGGGKGKIWIYVVVYSFLSHGTTRIQEKEKLYREQYTDIKVILCLKKKKPVKTSHHIPKGRKENTKPHKTLQLSLALGLLEDRLHLRRLHDIALDLQLARHEEALGIRFTANKGGEVGIGELEGDWFSLRQHLCNPKQE